MSFNDNLFAVDTYTFRKTYQLKQMQFYLNLKEIHGNRSDANKILWKLKLT
jgi:hypothetical protein